MTPKTDDEKIQAHGLTQAEMRDLQYKQVQEQEEFIEANNAGDKIADKYFKEDYADYKIPATEKHIYHVAEESRSFHPTSGEKTSVPTVQKYHKQSYEFQKANNGFVGKVTHILHNPELEGKEVKGAQGDEGEEDEDDFEAARAKKTKDLSKLSKAKLVEKYKEVKGVDAPEDATKEDLVKEIVDSEA